MGQKVDKRSDIYSMGCVMYEALCGKPPHHGGNVFETFHKHSAEMAAPLEMPGQAKALVERLDSLVFRALEKQPDKRYQSMSEFEAEIAAVEKALDSGQQVTGLSHGIGRQQRTFLRYAKSFPKTLGALVLLACILASAGACFWQRFSWFFAEHQIAAPSPPWINYLRPRPKAKVTGDKQAQLDKGYAVLSFSRLQDNLPHYLDLWESRAAQCARLDAPSEEIEARRNILELQGQINGTTSPAYAEAAEQLAGCLLSGGDFKAAAPLLEDAISIRQSCETPAPKTNIMMGLALARLHKQVQAMLQLKYAIDFLKDKDARLSGIAYAIRSEQGIELASHIKARTKDYLALSDMDLAKAQRLLADIEPKSLLNEITLLRAYVNLESGNFKQASKLYADAMPYTEKHFKYKPEQFQSILDGYAIAAWHTGDILSADELHGKSLELGNVHNDELPKK
jgi:hypothetical protein